MTTTYGVAGLGMLAAEFTAVLGPAAVITDRQRLRTYECDGLAQYRVVPGIVVLPESAEQIAAVVKACADAGVPFVARGSGTGLSGGALPHAGVLIVTSRMNRILEVDPANERAIVEPGVINLAVTRAAAPQGWYFAPDPSSQQICSVGGNVAENSGGAHCLKYGFTTHHVLGAEVVTPDGELVWLGSTTRDVPGYDLLGAFVGSEGTLGIATKIVVRLLRDPESVRCLLAAFTGVDEAGAAVSAIIADGVTPAAIEMMDALAIEAAEAAVACGYPEGAGAVLIVELDGPVAEVEHTFAAVHRHCTSAGAFEIRVARDADQRAVLEGSQVRIRGGGPDQPRLHRAGRGDSPNGAAWCYARSPTCRPAPGCGWPMCSTPGTATSTRWSCSTRRSRGGAGRGGGLRGDS